MTAHELGQPVIGRPYVVSIVGPSAAGKSQLARRTATELGEEVASRIPTDYFFIPRDAGQRLSEFLARPLQYDWPLIEALLTQPIGTDLSTPDADFTTFLRRGERGGRPFTVRPVMIVDAMVAYPDADLLVRLEVPDEVRRERLRKRDIRRGSHVLANWEHLNATWQAALEEMRLPTMTLDGEQSIEANASALVGAIGAAHRAVNRQARPAGSGPGPS